MNMTATKMMAARAFAGLAGCLLSSLLPACTGEKIPIGRVLTDASQPGESGTSIPGCNGIDTPPTSPAGGYLTMDVNGTQRQFVLELPAAYDGKTPMPVLFAFHGTGSEAQAFLAPSYGDIRNGTRGRMLLVGPNGLSRDGLTGWVDFSSDVNNSVTQIDIDFFDALVDHLRSNYCVDPDRVFALGHAAGGMMANQLACLRGDRLRGVVAFAGLGPQESPGVACVASVAALIGYNPKEADCPNLTSGTCLWQPPSWPDTGWPTVQFWTEKNGCGDPGAMPTAAFAGNSSTGDPLPCKAFAGCDPDHPVVLCLHDYSDEWDGPYAFPTPWAAKAATDFLLALTRVR